MNTPESDEHTPEDLGLETEAGQETEGPGGKDQGAKREADARLEAESVLMEDMG